jgi:lipopolysaccharide/colanic/teichoic acid biosynthesis glycosyltransferase
VEASTTDDPIVRREHGSPVAITHVARGLSERSSAPARPLVARFAKRSFDIICSGLALIVLSPLLIAIAIAIKIDSAGPVLFRQIRIGRDGTPFSILKFRTMFDGADDHKHKLAHLNEREGLFKISSDPRVTPFGSFLRSTSLDELPQLFQVLFGQMSIVGPRPLIPNEDSLVRGELRRRLDVRPGLTGPWQVGGPAAIPLEDMARLDCTYVDDQSFVKDVSLIARTVPLVVRRRGL